MFAAGNNSRYQLIVDSNAETATACEIVCPPIETPIDPQSLKCFSIGGEHCAFITNEGRIYASGSDLFGQIGTSQSIIYQGLKEVKFNKVSNRFEWLHCGSLYTMYIADNGSLVYCSNGCKNRKPEIIRIPTKPIYVTGSTSAPIVVDENGDFYVFEEDPKEKPKFYHLPEPVISIGRCNDTLNNSFTNIVAVTKSGVAYGNGSLNNNESDFAPIESLNGIKVKSAHGYVAHCIVVDCDGNCYAYGNNSRGQLGLGNTENASSFVKIDLNGQKITVAAVGNSNSYFVTETSKLLSCGANIHGQMMLAEPNRQNNTKPIESCLGKDVKFVWSGNAAAFALSQYDAPLNPCSLLANK
ncbi:hypothetical protein TRFO_27867 [Tritrichomonas foetus]|uniref:Regulator of chromosome condensation n=1 Tax=Tritrichomonas foetus TaxID=1144522 RepID=A0A1J4JZL5_9EUKA|nr:hypothetical protein TRFO_27867 [Tritrichomonas foetus]|eukprot:OHT04601.1 hypothetical protein TRFO_27867 [Tritrichomonas foetus]